MPRAIIKRGMRILQLRRGGGAFGGGGGGGGGGQQWYHEERQRTLTFRRLYLSGTGSGTGGTATSCSLSLVDNNRRREGGPSLLLRLPPPWKWTNRRPWHSCPSSSSHKNITTTPSNWSRFFGTTSSSSSNKGDGTEDDTPKIVAQQEQEGIPTGRSHLPVLVTDTVNASFKGMGQVIFLNSTLSGKIILASLCLGGDPLTATLAVLGTVTSTGTAMTCRLNNDTIQAGLCSYNGCLVGCAASVFFFMGASSSGCPPPSGSDILNATLFTVTGAAASTMVTASLSKAMPHNMPQWTYAFNLVTLTALLRIQPLQRQPPVMAISAEVVVDPVVVNEVTATTATAAAAATAAASSSTSTSFLSTLATAPLVGLSQIFVVESAWTGAGILTAIATYSPLLAGHALAGSATGCVLGSTVFDSGAAGADVAAGLWGFNPALTSMGIGVFFVHTREAVVLSLAGAAATACVYAALQPVFADAFGIPCLTLPFCITMSACYLLASPMPPPPPPSSTPTATSTGNTNALVPGLYLASNPHSPEKNAM
jgi:urea transporter